MKLLKYSMFGLATIAMAVTVNAQPPEGGRPGRPGGGAGRGAPAPSPLVAALDADKDGEISAAEIENAVAALKSLDKNKDGKLTQDETRPPRPQFGGRGGQQPQRGPADMIAEVMKLDKNGDGKVTKEEAGDDRRVNFVISRADTNEDGAVSKEEIEKMVAQFRQRGGGAGRPGGGAGRPGGGAGRPGGGGRPGAEGGRPQRPPSE